MAARHEAILNAIANSVVIDDHTGKLFTSPNGNIVGIYETDIEEHDAAKEKFGGMPVIALVGARYFSLNDCYVDDEGRCHISTWAHGVMYPEYVRGTDNDPVKMMARFNKAAEKYEAEVGIKTMRLVNFYAI